jgi:tetratricopeptide (TPR) repeat protein
MQPLWATPRNNLAKLYMAQGKKKESIDKFKSAIQSDPKNPTAYLSLALLYEGDREFQNAIQVYEMALKENPNFWFAANNLAFLLCEQSNTQADLERALKLSQKALELEPENPAILDTIGWIYYRMQDLHKARGLIEKALAAAPDAPILNYHMGMVHFKNGEAAEARKKLEKALEDKEAFYGRQEAEETLNTLKVRS